MFSSKPSILKVLIKHYLTMISKALGVTGITPERKGLEEIILGEMLTKSKNRVTNGTKVEQNIQREVSEHFPCSGNLRI